MVEPNTIVPVLCSECKDKVPKQSNLHIWIQDKAQESAALR